MVKGAENRVEEPPLLIEAPVPRPNRQIRTTVPRGYHPPESSVGLYHKDEFVLLQRSLRGFSHILASREGLYAVGLGGIAKLADGQFFGVTVDGTAIYCFEASGPIPSLFPCMGKIVRLALDGREITGAAVVVKGLPNGCHQIDLIKSDLYICDTYNSRLFKVDMAARTYTVFAPWGEIGFQDFDSGYPHMNSVVGLDGVIYLMLHHCSRRTGKPSQIVEWLPAVGAVGRTATLAGGSCHNIVFLEDKSLLVCNSDGGGLSNGRRNIVTIGSMFTRGLSVDHEFVVVGSSFFSRRDERGVVAGEVCFLDRAYREVRRFVIPAAATEIRKIDGQDLSLTRFSPSLPADGC